MNICHVSPHYLPSFAGITTVIREISAQELKRGHEVTVLCYFPWKPWRETDVKNEVIEGVNVIRLKNRLKTSFSIRIGRFCNRFVLPFELFHALSGRKIDVMHIAGVHNLAYGAMIYAKLKKIPVMLSLYGEELRYLENYGKNTGFIKKIKLKFRYLLYKIIFKNADEVSCSSKSLDTGLKNLGLRNNSHIIFNGVNVDKFPLSLNENREVYRKKFGIFDMKTIIGSVGGISDRKGYDILIDVFAKVARKNREIGLVIVGGGDIDSLRKIARQLEVEDKIHFAGAVSYEQLVEIYPVFDIYVQLPRSEEGVSQTALEAAMLCKPTVLSDCGAMRDSVYKDVSGYIIPIGLRDEIALKILSLVQDEQLRNKMGNEGRKWVLNNFSYDKIAMQYINVFETLHKKRLE